MNLRIAIGTPPHRESRVAGIELPDPRGIYTVAEIYIEKGVRKIAIYPKAPGRKNNIPWELPLADFMAAIHDGVARLDAYEDSQWDRAR